MFNKVKINILFEMKKFIQKYRNLKKLNSYLHRGPGKKYNCYRFEGTNKFYLSK